MDLAGGQQDIVDLIADHRTTPGGCAAARGDAPQFRPDSSHPLPCRWDWRGCEHERCWPQGVIAAPAAGRSRKPSLASVGSRATVGTGPPIFSAQLVLNINRGLQEQLITGVRQQHWRVVEGLLAPIGDQHLSALWGCVLHA